MYIHGLGPLGALYVQYYNTYLSRVPTRMAPAYWEGWRGLLESPLVLLLILILLTHTLVPIMEQAGVKHP